MTHTFLAQIRNPVLPPIIGGGTGADNYQSGGTALGAIINELVGALFIAGFLLAFFYMILGGFTWITAGGDKTKLEKARGEIIVAAAYALTSLVGQFFGLSLRSLPIPTIGK